MKFPFPLILPSNGAQLVKRTTTFQAAENLKIRAPESKNGIILILSMILDLDINLTIKLQKLRYFHMLR
jgi:hypothetical protein